MPILSQMRLTEICGNTRELVQREFLPGKWHIDGMFLSLIPQLCRTHKDTVLRLESVVGKCFMTTLLKTQVDEGSAY